MVPMLKYVDTSLLPIGYEEWNSRSLGKVAFFSGTYERILLAGAGAGAGHLPQREVPDAVRRNCNDFLICQTKAQAA